MSLTYTRDDFSFSRFQVDYKYKAANLHYLARRLRDHEGKFTDMCATMEKQAEIACKKADDTGLFINEKNPFIASWAFEANPIQPVGLF